MSWREALGRNCIKDIHPEGRDYVTLIFSQIVLINYKIKFSSNWFGVLMCTIYSKVPP